MHGVDWTDIATFVGLGASVATIIAVVISSHKYFAQKNIETARASQNLYLELKNTLLSLDPVNHPAEFYHAHITDLDGNNKTAYFMGRSLNHDFYDSLIYSGKINFLDPALQQRVQDIFKRIKLHNQYVDVVFQMTERNNGDVPYAAYKYCVWMDNSEKYLQRELPKMLESLGAYFNLNSQM